MLNRNDGVTSEIVRTMWGALVIVGVCAPICSAINNFGFMDYLDHENLSWVKKNVNHPKWEQMLNTANMKTMNKLGLYGVHSVTAAEDKDGTHYDLTFWAINVQNELPTCHIRFFIPLFGRHRDMIIKYYKCEDVTQHQDAIADLTHMKVSGQGPLLSLNKIR